MGTWESDDEMEEREGAVVIDGGYSEDGEVDESRIRNAYD
jgi:hypothetical protein